MASGGQTEIFYGWRVVAAVLVLAMFGWGVGFYGPPVYLHAIHETRGWSLDIVSIAVTVHFLFGAIVVVNLPRFHEQFGVPRVTKPDPSRSQPALQAGRWLASRGSFLSRRS